MRIPVLKTRLKKDTGLPELVCEKVYSLGWLDRISEAKDVMFMLSDLFGHGYETEEFCYLVCLNTRRKVLGVFEVSHGAVGLTCMNPREILLKALAAGAVYIILTHNHPGGDVAPSGTDKSSTIKLVEACNLIGVPLIDHIVISEANYHSMKENETISFNCEQTIKKVADYNQKGE